jgi:hypothetical protein
MMDSSIFHGLESPHFPDGFENRVIRKRRLKDARPKANSRGFLNPWEKRRIK